MFKKLGALALVLAVAGTLAAVALSSGSDREPGKRTEVIRVLAKLVDEAIVDVGPEGLSLGDQRVFTNDLFKRGKKVGFESVICTIVRLEGDAVTNQCRGVSSLPKGQIVIRTMNTFTEEGVSGGASLVGGTGRYRTAHGVLRVRDTDQGLRLTFRIIR